MNNEKIAIIGLGIIAPKAMNKDEFWKNVLEGRNCVSEVPADRWDWKLYYSEDHKTQDKTYSKIGGFIEGFKFDSIKYKIPPQTASQISRLQQMTIEAARMALEDSGYDKKPFDPKKAAAVIGNAMGAMRKEFTDLRVYKFYNEDLLKKTATFAALDGKKREAIISEYEAGIDRDILKITEDTMPGELSNVTAGRIANVFNLNGPNMTMDAACASSLAALDYCVLGLRAGKFDMAVAGGADEMMSPPAYVKFCKIGALSADGSWTFDERANGFVMAEAVSIYILKRLSDAVRDGDKIYALINSVGASSDGKGKGITAPNPKGQRIAIENAFSQVDYSPADVDMVEAHGTATKVGDAAEVQVLKEVFGPHMDGSRKIGLTSIKSQIGHTKAAAGAVGIAKTALALYNKILPPSINCVKPNPGIDLNLFRVITKKEEWKKQGTRRANVSSFGFGGANFHVTMEEYTGPGHQLYIKAGGEKESSAVEIRENPKIPFSHLQGEAAIFTAPTQKGVIDQAKEFAASVVSKWHETYPLVQFTHTLAEKPREKWGVSIVAKSPADLKEKIAFLEKSAKEETWTAPPLNLKLKGVYTFKTGKNAAKTGFLFPGQGSQYVDMMRDLAGKYKIVQDTFDEADAILEKMIDTRLTEVLWSKPEESKEELEKREASIKQTQLTQPAMMTADIAMFRLLGQFGIKPDMAIGHSLGEYAAATAAGIFTFENGLRAVTSRAKEMSKVKVKDPGKMASVAWPHNKVEAELKKIKGYVICANKNCPLQTVIAGEKKAVEQAIELFTSLGVQAQEIAVSHAFHSSIIEPAMGPYRQFLESIPISPSAIPILSNVTADYFPADRQGVYDMLIKQMVSPVEFIKQLERMYSDGVRTFIECGPKRVLSAFAASTFKNKSDITILSSNHPKRGGITEFNDLLANMTALGIPVKWGGKLPVKGGNFFNPYYQNWAIAADAADTRGESQVTSHRSQASDSSAFTPQSSSFNQARFEALGINLNDIAFSGIAAGTPGTWDNLFREHNLDEILEGRNMIEPIPADWRAKQIGKNIIRVVKSPDGNHRIEKIDSVDQAIKLSARKGVFDLEKEFGVPKNIANAMDNTFRMALGAGVLALKDAGLPLIHYYKKTTTGSWLPEKWALPEPLASETGVIFASAFPVMESLIKEISAYFMDKYAGKSPAEMWEVYDSIISRLSGKEDKQALRQWMEQNFKPHHTGEKKDSYTFSQNFLLKAIPIGDSQFAQWVGAKGPSTHISAACASTTQAVHIAESWIRAGKAKRVVVVAADDITNETVNEWTLPGFLASGTATTKENISEAALPFDKRRHGLIVGSAAVALVIEDETLVRARGMKPLARLLLSDSANSAFHVTRLDTGHVASVMEKFVAKIERLYGLDRNHLAAKTLFMSHETYTPARGGSASAEVQALKKAFGSAADKVVVSNVKGFTGHTMGASLEDAVAIRALNTGIVPPIANYKEPDPELAGINLSKGGKYDLEYALRFAAGFGSHMAMSFMQRTYKVGEARIENNNLYQRWLSEISSDTSPELEVVLNTLRVKDKKGAAQKAPQPAISHKPEAISQTEAGNHKGTPKEAYGLKPTAYGNFSEDAVRDEILSMITGKTGYPKDMLELDLDMEADLGIDTVKQAELFAAIREHYSIPRRDNVALKDYPTIRHCIRFVLDETGHKSQVTSHKPETTAKKPVTGDLQPVTAVAPSASAAFSEDAVQAEILSMISEKTGYPKDMLELDLDMEADLGIDTVKQAELFAAIREHYSIPRRDNVALKDYPTIRHCIRFVLDETGHKSQVTSHKPETTAKKPVTGDLQPVTAVAPSASAAFSEDAVQAEILSMISEKTGYPKDMLELDLDMEADLGIDTVKQAELFAAIREHYSIPRRDNVALKDYPTIRHCIRFVLDETGHKSQVTSHKPETTAKKPVTGDLQPVTAVAPSASAAFSEDAVQAEILSMISEKTGYPKDILELDLNMEADLGIDTVKQAELFAAIREHYSIPRRDNVALKDYPTIRHCIRFVLDETGHKSQVTSHKPETTAKKPVTGDLQPVTAVAPSASAAFSEDSVQAEILSMISEKTGYPKDILELDLNMEADLGIDTVKQAELFAAIREHYSIPRRDNVALQDYPTIRHCIRFVLDETGAVPAISHKPEAISKPEPKQVSASGPSDLSPQPSAYSPGIQTLERPHTKTSVKKAALQPDLLDVTSNAPKEEKPAYPKRHIRYVPVIAPAPIGQEIIKKLSPKRPVVVFGEDLDLLKAFRAELNKHRVDSFIFTSAKTKMKDSITVDFKDLTALDKTTADFAAAHPDVQGVFYLMGCMVKSLSDDTAAFTDLKHYALGLFAAGKHFNKALNNTTEGHPTFMAVVSTLDGGFGYKAKDAYDPVYGAIYGITMCLRKELEKTLVKMIDFEPSASNQAIVQKTFYELLYSDKRLAVAYQDGKRFTMLARPETLDTVQARTPLEGKTVLITGGGRGLGALFAKILAERFKPNLILLDIITLDENSAKWAAMSGEELAAYKTKGLWQELKKKMDKPTPAILEKEFTRIKDSALLYKSITELKAAGSKVTYCKCDLNDSDAFDAVMEKIKADFGRIDGVVHFAGLERSKMVADKTFEEFLMIFNTKAASAINLWKAGIVKDAGFWVMISSVAGKFGNLGQSDYAAASDYIAKFANSLSNKGSRGLSVDMTAYANVGMAMRPGVEAFLKSQEMEFLYPEEGMNAVADELVYGRAPEIVLSGSLGKLDWDKQLEFAPDFPRGGNSGLHFVENIRSCAKGSSLAATTKFSLERDPYLADHSINGTPYVPGVMGLETFAEAASAVSGAAPQALKNVHFTVPIKLLREKPVEIIIKAGAAGTGFEFKIESDFVNARGIKMGNTRTHFTAEAGARSKSSWEKLEKPELPKARKYAVTGETIYKTYFHGPSFQVLAGLLSIQKESVLAVYKRPEAPLWKTAHPKLIFHPMVIESLFQACGYRDVHFERKITLPDAVEEVTVYDNNPHDPAELYLYGLYKGADEDGKTLYDAYAFDADFNLFAEIKNYRMIATQI